MISYNSRGPSLPDTWACPRCSMLPVASALPPSLNGLSGLACSPRSPWHQPWLLWWCHWRGSIEKSTIKVQIFITYVVICLTWGISCFLLCKIASGISVWKECLTKKANYFGTFDFGYLQHGVSQAEFDRFGRHFNCEQHVVMIYIDFTATMQGLGSKNTIFWWTSCSIYSPLF